MNIFCKYHVNDTLVSQQSGEVYLLTAIGKRKCLVEVSNKGGRHEFERSILKVNEYIKINE